MLFQALYDYQPNESDVQPMSAWLAVMKQSHEHLAKSVIYSMQFPF